MDSPGAIDRSRQRRRAKEIRGELWEQLEAKSSFWYFGGAAGGIERDRDPLLGGLVTGNGEGQQEQTDRSAAMPSAKCL